MGTRPAGFSLIELIIVILVVAIGAVIVGPNVVQYLNQRKCGANTCDSVVATQPAAPPTVLLPRGEELVAANFNPRGPNTIMMRQQIPNSSKVLFKVYRGSSDWGWAYKPIPEVVFVQDTTPAPIQAEVNNCESPK
jgi:prepilin-type N-terminal cleavage/methylation domain-containing protein